MSRNKIWAAIQHSDDCSKTAVGPTAVWERESFEISKFYSNIANIGSEDNVNMAGTDTVCNIGSQRGTFDTWTMLLQLV